jgi:hypothetical protein
VKTPVVTGLSAFALRCAARYDSERRRYIPYRSPFSQSALLVICAT